MYRRGTVKTMVRRGAERPARSVPLVAVGCGLVLALGGCSGSSGTAAATAARPSPGSAYTLMQMNLCLSGLGGCYARVEYPAVVREAITRVREARPDAAIGIPQPQVHIERQRAPGQVIAKPLHEREGLRTRLARLKARRDWCRQIRFFRADRRITILREHRAVFRVQLEAIAIDTSEGLHAPHSHSGCAANGQLGPAHKL